jgi:shikimate kinase
MSVILIGYRGSGKTTLGQALAHRLGWGFVDLDQLVVHTAGLSIKNIFQTHGEAHFRRLETQQLLESLRLKDHVLSLGGGAVLAEENRRAIADSGHAVVYLKADVEELHRRIVSDPTTAAQRPDLTHLGGSIEEIRSLLTARAPIYEQLAWLSLDVTGRSIDAIIDAIVVELMVILKSQSQPPAAKI